MKATIKLIKQIAKEKKCYIGIGCTDNIDHISVYSKDGNGFTKRFQTTDQKANIFDCLIFIRNL